MAYLGTTQSSTIVNPPIRLAGAMGGTLQTASTGGDGGQLWLWNSSNGTTDAVGVNTYFTDGKRIGMKKGDVIIAVGCTGTTVGLVIGVIGAVTTDGCGIASTGSIITSTFT